MRPFTSEEQLQFNAPSKQLISSTLRVLDICITCEEAVLAESMYPLILYLRLGRNSALRRRFARDDVCLLPSNNTGD